MDADTRAYVGDLIHTAEDHYRRAVALLHEAARIAGGEARDAPASPDYVPLPSPVIPKLL